MKGAKCTAQSPTTPQRGMALVELMIAMVLGLIVVGAAFAVFLSNQRSYSANEGLNRIQEGARVGLELIARDIRAAGGSACSNASELTGAGSDAQAFRDTPVDGDAASLTVTSAEDSAYRIASATATSLTLEAGQVDGDDATNAFSVGDTLLLCNARKSFIVGATGVSGLVITHDALPGGYDIGTDEFAGLATVATARFRNSRWFVAENTRGTSSLWVSREGGINEEVVEGVSAIAFQYRSVGGGYTATPAAGDIDAVHVQITLAGAPVDGQAVSRTASSVVNVRARTL